MTAPPSLDANTRQAWLARLELDDKIKGPILTALAQNEIDEALQLLETGGVSKKDIRSGDLKLPTGLTALHLAALFGDELVLDKLLELGADSSVTIYSQIASHSVATKYWMDARPLLFAIGAKDLVSTRTLLQAGARLEMHDAWPLYSGEWWRLTGRFDWTEAKAILQVLLEYQLDTNVRAANQKWTMLHYCVNMEPRDWTTAEMFFQQRYDTVEFLLQNGADALLKDTFGRTAYELVNERRESSSSSDPARREAEHLRADADRRLQVLLQQAMASRLDALRAKPGFRGSLQRFVVTSQALDRIPLLRSTAASIRRSSMSSFGAQSQATDVTTQG